MGGQRKTCGCGAVPINADGLCATCDDEMWIAGPPNHRTNPMDERSELVERLRKRSEWRDEIDGGTRDLLEDAADEIERLAALTPSEQGSGLREALEEARQKGQREGFAAAVQQLRDMSATKPKSKLADEAALLATSLEQSRIPVDALSIGGFERS